MLKKISVTLLCLLLLLAAAISWLMRPPSVPASQAFINGHVLTLDAANSVAEAVLLSDDIIVAVGDNASIKGQITADTVVYDLQGQTLIPGFIDAHGHFPGSGMAAISADLNSPPIGDIRNMAALLNRLQQQAANTPEGEWLLGIGYDDTALLEHRHPTRAELDLAVPKHPVFISHISGHMGVANSAALAISDIDESTINPVGGVYVKDPASGQLTGLLEENAITTTLQLAMKFSLRDTLTILTTAGAEYARVGVTTAQNGALTRAMATGLKWANKFNLIPMRIELWPLFDQVGEDLLAGKMNAAQLESATSHVGAIKIIADGSIQGYTGYLTQAYHAPYHGDENYRGYPRIPKPQLLEWVEKYHRAGYQLAIHGNGDAAIDDILDAIATAQQKYPRGDSRHIIIHAQMSRDDQLARMKALGVTPSFFVAHTFYWGDRHRDIFMGPARAARMSPLASAQAIGLPYTIHLDTPIVPMDPLFLIWTAVNRLSSSGQLIGGPQRIDALSALRATTIDAAWQIHQEDNRGSIEVGKLADLVVLSANPLQHPTTLKDIKVTHTLVGGRSIFELNGGSNGDGGK